MTSEPRRLGLLSLWLWGRGTELALWIWWLTATKLWSWFDLLFTLMLIYLLYLFDPLAYGFADEKGITYRRYLKQHFVSWDRVAGVNWKPRSTGLQIILMQGPSWRRKLQFGFDAPVKEAILDFLGRSTPEIVVWLQEQVRAAHTQTRLT